MGAYEIDKLFSANIVLTNACNSRCRSCHYWRHSDIQYLGIDIVTDFFRTLQKYQVQVITLTGGEPTLHPLFAQIVEIAKSKYGFSIILTTNGIDIENACKRVMGCIEKITISFDAFTKEQYRSMRGVDKFESVLSTVRLLKTHYKELNVNLSCLIQKSNYLDLKRIYHAALDTGADSIMFNVPVIDDYCYGRTNMKRVDDASLVNFSEEDIEVLHQTVGEIALEDTQNLFLEQKHDTLIRLVDSLKQNIICGEKPVKSCYMPLFTISLNEYAKVKPCLYLAYEFPFVIGEDPVNCNYMIEYRKTHFKNSLKCNVCQHYL